MKSLCKVLDVIFLVCLVGFVALSVVMLLVQTGALISLNGELAVSIHDFVVAKGGVLSAIAAVVTFALGYLRKTNKPED